MILPDADLRVGDAGCLPWADQSFDIVFQFTVFSSVLDADLKKKIAGEMKRVLKPDGIILWYDFFVNNPWNPHVRGISSSEIKSLFLERQIDFQRITLAPPLSKLLAPFSIPLCAMLEKIKLFNTHYLAVIKKS